LKQPGGLRILDKHKISSQVRRDLKLRGWDDSDLKYVSDVLGELGYTDSKYARSGKLTLESLNPQVRNLLKPIDDERFTELHDSTNDTMPEIAEFDLNYEQVTKLSPAERQQYRDQRAKYFSEQKATISHGQTNFESKMENLGLKSDEESNKKSTIIPPKGLWGVSDTYYYIKGVAERFDTIGKYLQDIAKQVYVFKLSAEIDKNALKLLESYHDNRCIPLWECALVGSEEITNILENVQDEKNRDTALGWMKKGMDKHWNYGNHGAGEVDYIQTGEYIFRLGDKENVVVRVPIKREFTREQVGDKTTVKLLDASNQIHIKCPECGLKFNKPIVGDEERDLFAGDLFYKATNILLENDLSKAIEEICDNAIFIQHKTPEQWFQEKTGKDIKKTIVVTEKPEKIKTENLDPKDRAEIGYNIYWGRAHRTADKSEHFSDNS
jgi:hypothetical protein